jgi:hypothetical protein
MPMSKDDVSRRRSNCLGKRASVRAQKQPHLMGQKEKDGCMEEDTSTRVVAEAKAKPLAKSLGYSLRITRTK